MADRTDVMEMDDDEPVATTNTPAVQITTEDEEVVEAAPSPTATTPFVATPKKLYDLPEIANRYAGVSSAIEGVVYRDSQRFCLKPPFWEQWQTYEYRKFAEFLESFDLTLLARELNKPVEEVYHMYHAVVTKPLYHARKAKNKGKQGMQGWFKLYNEYGTPSRVWAENVENFGELNDITNRTIHLILHKTGSKCKIKLEELKDDDFEWIHENVNLRNRQILSGHAVNKPWKEKTEDGLPPYKKTLKRKPSPEPATPSKQARLTENGIATAPAKMRTTPSALNSTPQLSRVLTNETPTGPSTARQPSIVPGEPSPSKAPAATAPSTPGATRVVKLHVHSPEQFQYRTWTTAAVAARFADTTDGCVVLIERKTLRRLTVPLSALSQLDKDWLNARRKEKLITAEQFKVLKTGKAPIYLYRHWTDQGIIAKYIFVSCLRVHLEREEGIDDRLCSISIEDFTKEDKAWIKEHISLEDKQTLGDYWCKKAAKEAKDAQAARGSTSNPSIDASKNYVVIDSASDKDADYESEASDVVQTQRRSRVPVVNRPSELADRSMSVAVTEPGSAIGQEDEEGKNEVAGTSSSDFAIRAASRATDAIMADSTVASTHESQTEADGGSGSGSDTAIDEPYEVITGAPIRQWTDFGLVGNLAGIAERKAFLRVEGREDMERLPTERWSAADLAWVKEYLVSDQRKILSGKAKVKDTA